MCLGLPDPLVRGTGTDPILPFSLKSVERTEIMPAGTLIFKKFFLASLKSLKKGVGIGSYSVGHRYGSGSAPKCHGSPTLLISIYN
jgi:hypothetical protein